MARLPALPARILATLAFAAVLTAGLAAGSAWSRADSSCSRVLIASSDEKARLLKQLADAYSSGGHLVDGRCVKVDVTNIASGEAELRLETPDSWQGDRPDVWSPASTAWLNLLRARSRAGAGLLPAGVPDHLFQSPLVIAMPQPMATALGYPQTPLGWHDLLTLVNDPRGWASRGHPEWGAFRLAKTNPTISTSGLHALVATYLAAGADLTNPASVDAPAQRDFVAAIEAGVEHYGPTASDFLRSLRDADSNGAALGYVSAVAVEEKELVDYNRGVIARDKETHLPPLVPMVPIYPREGTLVADHPYEVLTWSSHQAAARAFYEYVQEPAQQSIIDANGFRDRGGQAGASLRPQVDPLQPAIVVSAPAGAVMNAMLVAWRMIRKPARLLVLIDVAARGAASESAALAQAMGGLGGRDRAGVWTFPAAPGTASSYTEVRAVGAAGDQFVLALAAVRSVAGRGDVDAALRAARDSMAGAYDPHAIDAIVLLEMAPPPAVSPELLRMLRGQSPDAFVRVFTVGPDTRSLDDLALAGRGGHYAPGTARNLLSDVVSNF